MSNLETVQAIYEAFGKGDIPAILERLAPDVEWETWESNSNVAAGVPWFVPRRGPAEVAEFFAEIGRMEILDVQVPSLMEGGNQVAAEFVFEANLPDHGGRHLRDEEMHLWTFGEDGTVIRFRHYVDTAKHIAAYKG